MRNSLLIVSMYINVAFMRTTASYAPTAEQTPQIDDIERGWF